MQTSAKSARRQRARGTLDWRKLESKWQKKWAEAKIFETDPKPDRPKFFVTVAYPYVNSPQHIGHGRTYTMGDVDARYHRMRGYNTLFPIAFHYTGTPIAAMSKRLSQADPEIIETFTRIYHVPSSKLDEMKDPLRLARYFHEEIRKGMKEIGLASIGVESSRLSTRCTRGSYSGSSEGFETTAGSQGELIRLGGARTTMGQWVCTTLWAMLSRKSENSF